MRWQTSSTAFGEAMVAAGDSAGAEAARREAAVRRLQGDGGRWRAGAAGERAVAQALSGLVDLGWTLLADRVWGRNGANIDLIVVGSGGVFVIDVKTWAAPRITRGALFNGAEDRTSDLRTLLAATDAVAAALSCLDLAPAAIKPLLIFSNRAVSGRNLSVRILGTYAAVTAISDAPPRLTAAQVQRIAEELTEAFPAKAAEAPASETADDVIFSLYDHLHALEQRAIDGTIEDWMTFLHPAQTALVRRNWGGPARINGGPGTGKTVVALHRSVHLARRDGGPILFMTLAKSLPKVQGTLFNHLDSACSVLVTFTNVHKWCYQLLKGRGRPMWVKDKEIDRCFADAWSRCAQRGVLSGVNKNPSYWRDEIDYVIKGRGLRTVDDYFEVERRGRVIALSNAQRRAAWQLYNDYEDNRRQRGLDDFNDMISAALSEVMREPVNPPYSAVIVDEAQDLSLIAVRLVHALVGDAPNGLLLIGDGKQNVTPHAFRLAEAGLTIRGDRAQVLRVNYRNRAAIHAAAQELAATHEFDDPDGFPAVPDEVNVVYEGGVVEDFAGSQQEQEQALVAAIRARADPGACAVLCASNWAVTRWLQVLSRAGLSTQNLDDYDGRPTTCVKVGTFFRVKGLGFKHVFLPDWTAYPDPLGTEDRESVARRRAYVGLSRARDSVWRGSSNPR